MKATSKNQLIKIVTEKLGFEVVEVRYFPQYRNTMFQCWDIELVYQGTEYLIEGNTVQELLDNILEELM